MCNAQRCRDLHTIKTVSSAPRQRVTIQTPVYNPFQWYELKTKANFIPDYPDAFFHYHYFWVRNDFYNYYSFNANNLGERKESKLDNVRTESDDGRRFLLWIDAKNPSNCRVEKRLKKHGTVHIDFCETFSQAASLLSRQRERIKPSAAFQIICRGYYKDENKNPLNLLDVLDDLDLSHVPVLVFTQDKSGLQHHLENQASSMGMRTWKRRLFITSDDEELVNKLKENISKK